MSPASYRFSTAHDKYKKISDIYIMDKIKCFLIEVTDRQIISLRRYAWTNDSDKCPVNGYHTRMVFSHTWQSDGAPRTPDAEDKKDPRWPKVCECGYVFKPTDEWQFFNEWEYKRTDSGEFTTLRSAPVGAIWRADWYEDMKEFCGTDGKSYVCKTPDGDWCIDQRASNCTLPKDDVHKCWCRHGEAPDFTVDKNGNTCSAGAGSILKPKWHGFLTGGYLVQC